MSFTLPANTKHEALQYLLTLCSLCQERGGYTLDNAVQLDTAITCLRPQNEMKDIPASAEEEASQTRHIQFVVSLLEKSQKLGNLSMQEAWTVFNAQKIVFD